RVLGLRWRAGRLAAWSLRPLLVLLFLLPLAHGARSWGGSRGRLRRLSCATPPPRRSGINRRKPRSVGFSPAGGCPSASPTRPGGAGTARSLASLPTPPGRSARPPRSRATARAPRPAFQESTIPGTLGGQLF